MEFNGDTSWFRLLCWSEISSNLDISNNEKFFLLGDKINRISEIILPLLDKYVIRNEVGEIIPPTVALDAATMQVFAALPPDYQTNGITAPDLMDLLIDCLMHYRITYKIE